MNLQSNRYILFQETKCRFKGGWRLLVKGFSLVVISTLALPTFAQTAGGTADQDTTKSTSQVVQVAFGQQSKDRLTSSISVVGTEQLRKTHTSSIYTALIGRLAGLSILNNGAAPGFDDPGSEDVAIRGRHTTLNNSHTVIVDGIQINSLSYISVDEIESIAVLKDAAALAMYGVKGGNGVLLVTTKRGAASGKLNVGFNARYGAQAPINMPKFSNSYDYARLYNEARINDGLPAQFTDAQLNGYQSGSDPYLYPDVNWYDEILRKSSPIQDYSLTFNGGSKQAKYFLMVGYMDNQGLYAHTDQENNANISFQRMNFRGNVDLSITRGLSAQIGLGGNIQDRKFPVIATDALWSSMALYAPNLYSVRTPEGQITGSANYPNNPVGQVLDRGYNSRHDRNIQSYARVNHKLDVLTPGLNVFAGAMFDNEFYNRYDKTRSYAYAEPIVGTNEAGEPYVYYLQRSVDTDLTINTSNNYENNRIIFQGGFDYSRTFGNNSWNGLLLFQQDRYTALGNQSPFGMQNLAGRLNYGFKEKYLAEFTFSYSGVENYAPGKKFGFFPAISGGWVLHKEGFWGQNPLVEYLKLRASAGLVGNDKGASPRFDYNQYWATGGSYIFGTGSTNYPGLIESNIANPNRTWEKGLIYNVGFDATAFNGKLSLTAEAFREMRTDILLNMGNSLPSLSGIASAMRENRGEVLSYGTELTTAFRNNAGAVNYFIGGQFSFARNKVRVNDEIPRKELYSSRLDRPIGQHFGLETIGFFKDESDIIRSPLQTFSVVRPGDLKYKDQNGDGLIDVNDEVAIGTHDYPEMIYSINTGIGFKGVNLDLFFQGIANRSVYLNGAMFQPLINNANVLDWAVQGRWTPESHASATFPRLTTIANANNYGRPSDFWVRKANFLRLRNVELSYSLPKALVRRLNIEGVKIFVSGLNLISWDDLDVEVDPETLSAGYPVIKTYTAGLSLKF